MSISVPAQSPGSRLRQLHDVALASPPATTALPLLYDPPAGRWKAQQIGTAGIADGAITFPKLDVSAGNGFDGRWVNVTGDTMTGHLFITATNASLELGKTGTVNTPLIDFHSSANTHDFDSRIIASGGTATPGQGLLQIVAAVVEPSGTLRMVAGQKIDFADEVKDDKIDLWGGSHTIGVRGATTGYFVPSGSAHRFYTNNVERFGIADAVIGTTVPVSVVSAAAPQLILSNPTNATGAIAAINFATGSGYSTKFGALQGQWWFAFMDGGNTVGWGDDGTNLRMVTRNITLDTGRKIDFAEDNKDDKIDLYGGQYTIGIRGGIQGYFVPNTSSHQFYVNNTSYLGVSAAAVQVNSSNLNLGNGTAGHYLQLHGTSTVLGFVNQSAGTDNKRWEWIGDSAGTMYLRTVNDGYTVANIAISFQRSGVDVASTLIYGATAITSAATTTPMFKVQNTGGAHLFGIWWNGSIVVNSANVAGNGVPNGWGGVAYAPYKKIQVQDQNNNIIGYLPIYN